MNQPVLVLIFNKLHADRVIEPIRAYQPRHVYLSADGPRSEREAEKVEAVRRQWLRAIDWPCVIHLRFLERNEGCRRAVSGGIDWFFENEREGIIVEEDCLLSHTFFPFAESMLARYREDQRIASITAQNEQRGFQRGAASYYFSEIAHCWGWATWRYAWQRYREVEFRLPELLENGSVFRNCAYRPARAGWRRWCNRVLHGEVDSWAIIWSLTHLAHRGLSVVPNVNMVENLGFDELATHTSAGSTREFAPRDEMEFPCLHPEFVFADAVADEHDYRHCYEWTGSMVRSAKHAAYAMLHAYREHRASGMSGTLREWAAALRLRVLASS